MELHGHESCPTELETTGGYPTPSDCQILMFILVPMFRVCSKHWPNFSNLQQITNIHNVWFLWRHHHDHHDMNPRKKRNKKVKETCIGKLVKFALEKPIMSAWDIWLKCKRIVYDCVSCGERGVMHIGPCNFQHLMDFRASSTPPPPFFKNIIDFGFGNRSWLFRRGFYVWRGMRKIYLV